MTGCRRCRDLEACVCRAELAQAPAPWPDEDPGDLIYEPGRRP